MDKKVPVVRFKGFTDDWEQVKLGKLVEIRSGEAPSKFSEDLNGIPLIKVNDLNFTNKVQDYSKIRVKESTKFLPIQKNSIIFPKRGAAIMTNKVRMIAENSYLDTNLMALFPKQIKSQFLFYFIFKTGLFKIADTSTVPQINNKHIDPYIIILPTQSEQDKIGSFLSVIDKIIALYQEQNKLHKLLKDAIIQQTISKKNHSHPKIYLKDNPNTWEKQPLVKMIRLMGGYAFKSSDISEDGVLLYRISNVSFGHISYKDNVYLPHGFLENYSKFTIKPGDYLIALTRPIIDLKLKVGQASQPGLLNQRVAKIIFNYDSEFTFQVLQLKENVSSILNQIAGTDPPNLSTKALNKIYIPVPSKEVQFELGRILHSMDIQRKNTLSNAKNYQKLKDMFLQRLFL